METFPVARSSTMYDNSDLADEHEDAMYALHAATNGQPPQLDGLESDAADASWGYGEPVHQPSLDHDDGNDALQDDTNVGPAYDNHGDTPDYHGDAVPDYGEVVTGQQAPDYIPAGEDGHYDNVVQQPEKQTPPAVTEAFMEEPGAQEEVQTRFARLAKLGEAAQATGAYDRAIQNFDNALSIPGVPVHMLARVHSQLARCYEATGDARYCLKHTQAFLDCAERHGDEELLCTALTFLGVVYYKTQEFAEALATHQRALTLAGVLGNVAAQMRANANIGNVHAARGQFQEALYYHREQFSLAERLEDRDAVVRAALNLESDYASLHKYAEANTFEEKKRERALRRVTISTALGDRRQGRTVWSGWLVKHKGGDLAGPSKRRETRRFCVLQSGIFSYSNTTAMTRRAARYLRLEEIIDVQACEIWDDDRVSGPTRSFRIRVLDRAFYFSAISVADCTQWLGAFQSARADVARFGGVATMRGKMDGAASDMFLNQKPSNFSLLSGGSSSVGPAPSTPHSPLGEGPGAPLALDEVLSQAPEGFGDRNVDNPLYGDESFVEEEANQAQQAMEKGGWSVSSTTAGYIQVEDDGDGPDLRICEVNAEQGFIVLKNATTTAFSLYGYQIATADGSVTSHAFGVRSVPPKTQTRIWLTPGNRNGAAPLLEDDTNIYWRSQQDNGPNTEPIPLSLEDGFVLMDYDGRTICAANIANLVNSARTATLPIIEEDEVESGTTSRWAGPDDSNYDSAAFGGTGASNAHANGIASIIGGGMWADEDTEERPAQRSPPAAGKLDLPAYESSLRRNTLDHSEPHLPPPSSKIASEFADMSFALEQDEEHGESRTDVHTLSGTTTHESKSDFVDIGLTATESGSDFVDVGRTDNSESGTDAHAHDEQELQSLSNEAIRMLQQLTMG